MWKDRHTWLSGHPGAPFYYRTVIKQKGRSKSKIARELDQVSFEQKLSEELVHRGPFESLELSRCWEKEGKPRTLRIPALRPASSDSSGLLTDSRGGYLLSHFSINSSKI